MAEASPGLRLRGLTKIFGPRPHAQLPAVGAGMSREELLRQHGHVLALGGIDLDIPAGAVTVVMGLSGSGKSTLLRLLNRLIEPTAGEVHCGDVDVTALDAKALRAFRRRHMAMVFQRFALFPHRTVLRNVGYALEVQGLRAPQVASAARQWIERVGLAGVEMRYPSELSGGMQQRVGLARALAGDAPILLMDEAFSALDPLIRVEMQDLLLGLQRELRKTVVFITHDLDEALRLGDQVAILRDGRMVQHGRAADIVLRPADDYVRRFVRDVNRGRSLRCGALVQALDGQAFTPELIVGADDTLAQAAQAMRSAGATQALVHGADGQALGTLSMAAVVEQLVV